MTYDTASQHCHALWSAVRERGRACSEALLQGGALQATPQTAAMAQLLLATVRADHGQPSRPEVAAKTAYLSFLLPELPFHFALNEERVGGVCALFDDSLRLPPADTPAGLPLRMQAALEQGRQLLPCRSLERFILFDLALAALVSAAASGQGAQWAEREARRLAGARAAARAAAMVATLARIHRFDTLEGACAAGRLASPAP